MAVELPEDIGGGSIYKEYKGEISGIGDKLTRTNEITAEDTATLRNFITSWESGIIDGLNYSYTNDKVVIYQGLMFAYGCFGYFPKACSFYFNKTAAPQYHIIYAEIDRSVIPNKAVLKVKNNQSSPTIKSTTFRQDVLSSVKTGVYQLPLCRVMLSSNGIVQIEDLRVFPFKIKTVHYSDRTNKIRSEISPTATAFTQENYDNSEKIANVSFVHNVIVSYIDENIPVLTVVTRETVAENIIVYQPYEDTTTITIDGVQYRYNIEDKTGDEISLMYKSADLTRGGTSTTGYYYRTNKQTTSYQYVYR